MSRGLSKYVKSCLLKDRDSALLAIECYNKPAVQFRSGGYIVLMCVAWTSLLHAIFLKKGLKPIYKTKGRFKRVDGEYQYWELKHCVEKYFSNDHIAMRKNIEFFIPLRNKIEHKFMPELDADIFAECQSMLLNFDKIIEKEFSCKYCLRESLSFALQMFPSSRTLNMSINSKDSEAIKKFITNYRSSISTDIQNSGEYSFKAFLIQVANHQSKDALPIQFVPYDKLNEEEKKKTERIAALIKEKIVQIPVRNKDHLLAGGVVKQVQKGLGNLKITRGKKQIDKFNQDTHRRCWAKYKIRPKSNSDNPERTNSQYCIYDETYNNYVYTKEWVQFLIEKMSDEEEYNSLYK